MVRSMNENTKMNRLKISLAVAWTRVRLCNTGSGPSKFSKSFYSSHDKRTAAKCSKRLFSSEYSLLCVPSTRCHTYGQSMQGREVWYSGNISLSACHRVWEQLLLGVNIQLILSQNHCPETHAEKGGAADPTTECWRTFATDTTIAW